MGNLRVVGNRVLIRVKEKEEQETSAGLVVPPSVKKKREINEGIVVKCGPGYAVPNPTFSDEPWKEEKPVRHLPMDVEEGDRAFFLKKFAIKLEYEEEEFVVVPHSGIVILVREEDNRLDGIDNLPDGLR